MALYAKNSYLFFRVVSFVILVMTAILPIYSLSPTAKAITTYLRAHKARCDKQQERPLLLSHTLSGTPADDNLIPSRHWTHVPEATLTLPRIDLLTLGKAPQFGISVVQRERGLVCFHALVFEYAITIPTWTLRTLWKNRWILARSGLWSGVERSVNVIQEDVLVRGSDHEHLPKGKLTLRPPASNLWL